MARLVRVCIRQWVGMCNMDGYNTVSACPKSTFNFIDLQAPPLEIVPVIWQMEGNPEC